MASVCLSLRPENFAPDVGDHAHKTSSSAWAPTGDNSSLLCCVFYVPPPRCMQIRLFSVCRPEMYILAALAGFLFAMLDESVCTCAPKCVYACKMVQIENALAQRFSRILEPCEPRFKLRKSCYNARFFFVCCLCLCHANSSVSAACYSMHLWSDN